jgi:hypothetical protein
MRNPEGIKAAVREYTRAHPEIPRVRTLRKYGLTPEVYAQLFEEQGGACAICGREPVNFRLAVDHDHECCPDRKTCCAHCVRGLMCSNCNLALGLFGDSVGRLRAAISYLGRN